MTDYNLTADCELHITSESSASPIYTYYSSLCIDKIFVFSLSLIHPLLLNNIIYYESKEQLNFSFSTYTDFESRWGYWWSFEVSSTSFANYYSIEPWPPFFRISFSLTPRFRGSWPLNLVCELFSIELEAKRRFTYTWVPP